MTGAIRLDGREFTFRALTAPEIEEIAGGKNVFARVARTLDLALVGPVVDDLTEAEVGRFAGRLVKAIFTFTVRCRVGSMTAAAN